MIHIYRGSNRLVEFPHIIVSKRTKDFSWGFYCTNNLQQAFRRAKRCRGQSVVNCYAYTPNDKLKDLRFGHPDLEWIHFIAKCRAGYIHSWDIVEGPMADDTVWNYAQDYLEHRISDEAFLALLQFRYPTHQISFHTLAAFQTLQFIGEVDSHGELVRE